MNKLDQRVFDALRYVGDWSDDPRYPAFATENSDIRILYLIDPPLSPRATSPLVYKKYAVVRCTPSGYWRHVRSRRLLRLFYLKAWPNLPDR